MEIADFEQCLGTDLAGVSALSESFSAWGAGAALTDREIFQVNVVLEEVVTNVIVHGLGVGQPGWIRLRVGRRTDCLAIELRDSAPPFDPFEVPPPTLTAGIDERALGGLGVYFVRTMMDGWSYTRDGEQNIVLLHKVLRGGTTSGTGRGRRSS